MAINVVSEIRCHTVHKTNVNNDNNNNNNNSITVDKYFTNNSL